MIESFDPGLGIDSAVNSEIVMDGLSDRQRNILRAVVVEYVMGAEPVPSDLIAQKYELGVRSATVRNELAEITDLGYLEQPHTSAGRIPSDDGYRYYVDHMILRRRITPEERQKISSVTNEEETTRDLVEESMKALSRATRLLTAAITVRDAQEKVRNAVVTALGPDKVLLVLVMTNGHTENRILECPPGLTLTELGRVNAALEGVVAGKSLGSLLKAKTPLVGAEPTDTLLRRAMTGLKSVLNELTAGHIILEGEEFIISQPEYQRDPGSLTELLDSLGDEASLMVELRDEVSPDHKITIGRENKHQRHRTLSFVRRGFYVGEDQAGVIAIIGPTRMDYDRNVALLDFTSDAISRTLTKLFA